MLFEAEQRGLDPVSVLADRLARADPMPEYAVQLVEGVVAQRVRIDDILTTYAEGWALERMPSVDRTVLRLGVFELLWRDDVPDGVVLSEAVRLASELSTEESPRFVNGLLARVLALKPSLPV